jgi:hypothetical protein
MLYGSLIFIGLALLAAAFGLRSLPTVADTLAWFWFSVFLGLALSALWRVYNDRHHHR